MPLLTKVGTFTSPTANGAQAVTGVGFTPKVIILWAVGTFSGADGFRSADNFAQGMGYCTSPTNTFAQASRSYGGGTASAASRAMSSNAFILVGGGHAVFLRADLTSIDLDGFTLNWLDTLTSSFKLYYLALGGSDLTHARVVQWNTPVATGLHAVSGVGFRPDCVLNLHTGGASSTFPFTAGNAVLGLGAMTANGEQWASGTYSVNNVSPAKTFRDQEPDQCLTALTATGTIFFQASYASMDADGFTTNFTTLATTSSFPILSLCLKGGRYRVGTLAKSVAASPVSQAISAVGFKPKGLLLAGVQDIARTAPTTHLAYGLGASDGTTHFSTAIHDLDAVATPKATSYSASASVYTKVENGARVIDAQSGFGGFDSDGWALNWTTNDAIETRITYIAISDSAPQTAFAASDISVGSWTTDTGATTNLFTAIDEATASDVDFIQSPESPSTANAARFGVGALTDPVASSGHIVRYRLGKSAAGGDVVNVTVRLFQGTTLIATDPTVRAAPDAFVTYEWALTAAEADAITSYSDLRLDFSAVRA